MNIVLRCLWPTWTYTLNSFTCKTLLHKLSLKNTVSPEFRHVFNKPGLNQCLKNWLENSGHISMYCLLALSHPCFIEITPYCANSGQTGIIWPDHQIVNDAVPRCPPPLNVLHITKLCVSPIIGDHIVEDKLKNDTVSGGHWKLSTRTYNGISSGTPVNRMVNETQPTRITPIINQKATNQKWVPDSSSFIGVLLKLFLSDLC